MIGGIPKYILQLLRNASRGAEPGAVKSPLESKPAAAGKVPTATRIDITSNLRESRAAAAGVASPNRVMPLMERPNRRARLSAAQRLAIAAAVQTAMERLLAGGDQTAQCSAINDMMQEIEGIL